MSLIKIPLPLLPSRRLVFLLLPDLLSNLSDLVISSSQQQELPQPILILDLKLLSPVGFKASEEEEEEEESVKLGKKSLLEQ
jgi:hypothetical protein